MKVVASNATNKILIIQIKSFFHVFFENSFKKNFLIVSIRYHMWVSNKFGSSPKNKNDNWGFHATT